MIKKNTLILFLISLVIVVFYILSQQSVWFDNMRSKKGAITPPQANWLDIQSTQISKITFSMVGMDDVIIQRLNDTNWIQNNESGSVTPGKIEKFISELTTIQPLLILTEAPEPSATGLDNPEKNLGIELIDGKIISVKFGFLNPLQTGYYAQNDFNEVVLISKGSVDNIVNTFITPASTPTPENGS